MGCSATSQIQLIDHHRQTIMLFTGWKGFQPKKNEPRTKGIELLLPLAAQRDQTQWNVALLRNWPIWLLLPEQEKNATPH